MDTVNDSIHKRLLHLTVSVGLVVRRKGLEGDLGLQGSPLP